MEANNDLDSKILDLSITASDVNQTHEKKI
jgi:hypothetical protein